MNQRTTTAIVLAVCALLLLLGMVFSARVTAGIDQAAHLEATQHAPVATPPSLAPAKPAPARAS
jgi:hypothetical protein